MRQPVAYRSAIARLLLLIQLFMLTNAVVFRHAHRLPDGTIVVHAHPFLPKALGGDGSDPVQPNNHSKQQLIWLDALTDVAYPFAEPAFFAFQGVVSVLTSVEFWTDYQLIISRTFVCFQHRGPPF